MSCRGPRNGPILSGVRDSDVLRFRKHLQDELSISRNQARLLMDAIVATGDMANPAQCRLPCEMASIFMGGGGRAIPIHFRTMAGQGPVCLYIARPPELVGMSPVAHADTLRQCFATVIPEERHVMSSIHELIRVYSRRYRLDFSDLFLMLRRPPLVCVNRKQKWSNAK